MILKNFKNFLVLFTILVFSSSLHSEEKIDIWKKNENIKKEKIGNSSIKNQKKNIIKNPTKKVETSQKIEIDNKILENSSNVKVYGIYDPEDYNFNLNMWSSTKAEEVRASFKRLKKIKLSKTSNEILENILTRQREWMTKNLFL